MWHIGLVPKNSFSLRWDTCDETFVATSLSARLGLGIDRTVNRRIHRSNYTFCPWCQIRLSYRWRHPRQGSPLQGHRQCTQPWIPNSFNMKICIICTLPRIILPGRLNLHCCHLELGLLRNLDNLLLSSIMPPTRNYNLEWITKYSSTSSYYSLTII